MRTVVGLILTLLLTACSLIDIELQPRIRPLEEETVEGKGKAKILLLDVSGVLADETGGIVLGTPAPRVPIVARVREELQKAEEDDSVKALIVRINSPGGTITASDLIYREIDVFKTRRKIPVVAIMMDVAASGGYYAALAADTIVALPTTVTGSIGDDVYFYFDRTSPLWPEFSQATAIGMHFAGDWPELEMELWAVREERR